MSLYGIYDEFRIAHVTSYNNTDIHLQQELTELFTTATLIIMHKYFNF